MIITVEASNAQEYAKEIEPSITYEFGKTWHILKGFTEKTAMKFIDFCNHRGIKHNGLLHVGRGKFNVKIKN